MVFHGNALNEAAGVQLIFVKIIRAVSPMDESWVGFTLVLDEEPQRFPAVDRDSGPQRVTQSIYGHLVVSRFKIHIFRAQRLRRRFR